MSRYSLKPLPHLPDLFEIAVGWDPGLDTYFVTVFGVPDAGGEPEVRHWHGSSPSEIASVEALLARANEYADVPAGLHARLEADRCANPHEAANILGRLAAKFLRPGLPRPLRRSHASPSPPPSREPFMRIDYIIEGSMLVPAGTKPLDGVANQFRLQTGEVFSVHPVIEMASGPDTDDHRDLGQGEANKCGIEFGLYDRSAWLTPDD